MATTSKRSRDGARRPRVSENGVAAKHRVAFKRETAWNAPAVESTTVQRTLNDLWAEIAAERSAAAGRPRAAADGASMRTRTINLIAAASDAEDALRIERIVTSLTEFFPSRTVILVRDDPATEKGLAVRVAVEQRPTSPNQPSVQFETITVSAGRGREQLLASVAAPVLVPELPDFVWFPGGGFAASPLFEDLLPITDRLVVDTSNVSDPAAALRFLAGLLQRPDGEGIHLSDMAWTRVMPWRQIIAQFFDAAATLSCLDAIEHVTIEYGAPDAAARSGITAGLLLAGWLSTRLGWRAPGEELVRVKDGWKLTLRAGEKGRSREVIVLLKPSANEHADHCVGNVDIAVGGDNPGHFVVNRVSAESVQSVSQTHTTVSRIVYVRNLDDARLLSLELRVFNADPIYTRALAFAANLWPEGVAIS